MDKDRFIALGLLLVKDYAVLDKEGVCGVNADSIHLTTKSFLEKFDKYEISHRDYEQYPVKLTTEIAGVKFFTVTESQPIPKLLQPDYIYGKINDMNEEYRKAGE